MKAVAHKNLEEYVNAIRAKGRYAFSWEELKQNFKLSDKALSQSLYRLKKNKKIAQIRKGFYAIITPEYSNNGMLPPHLFIDNLMKSLNKKYYVGLLSAAALHGAAHQQPMEYHVFTEKPALRTIKNKKLHINFYVKKEWSSKDIVQKKTDAGYINVSSPELTALDLLAYADMGINRIFTILNELSEEMQVKSLAGTAKGYPQTTAVQRLGYLLDKEIGNQKLANILKGTLKDKTIFPVSLLKGSHENGSIDTDWKIIKNTKVESDL
ncbi:MAG TPA: type IV toxin-antitoxin system AbiEi family antitoxin [Salinimicrobium sp.]|nr:type IV toxin-antitoxin system AbiEi family antitoxin [Salinimicrobium sp.]